MFPKGADLLPNNTKGVCAFYNMVNKLYYNNRSCLSSRLNYYTHTGPGITPGLVTHRGEGLEGLANRDKQGSNVMYHLLVTGGSLPTQSTTHK